MPVEKVTISRNDQHYECFPDVAMTPGGKLICVYAERDNHSAFVYSNIVTRSSSDRGRSWSDRQVLIEDTVDETTGKVIKWNCPRIQCLSDGRLLIICDSFPSPRSREETFTDFPLSFWWSEDNGETWDGPHATEVYGVMPGRIIELPSGAWLLSAEVRAKVLGGAEIGNLTQRAFRSEDQGKTWQGPYIVGQSPEYELCEGTVLLLPSGELVCYMRENTRIGISAIKAISYDEGRSWEGHFRTPMDGCHRPVAGMLPSGKLMVTYRYQQGGKSGDPPLGPVGWKRLPPAEQREVTSYFARNTFAYVESVESALAHDIKEQGGIILPLDHDRSPMADGGYTGWVVLDDGRIFCVNYVMDDAPMCQIRGYWFSETDF